MALGCSKKDEAPAADTTAVAPAPVVNLADVAGSWETKLMGAGSDSVLVTYELVATGTTEGWVINLPNRPPVPAQVTVSGDSITITTGGFESVLRKGVQVASTSNVARIQGGKLVGTMIATYAVGPDSVRTFRFEGTKKP
jgi:hypothetical protein